MARSKSEVVTLRRQLSALKERLTVLEGAGEPERALRAIVEGTAPATGERFFEAVVKNLAQVLGFRYGFVGELVAPSRIRTLAVWTGDRFGDNFEYDLDGTPCESVVSQSVCFFSDGVQQRFPRDVLLQEMGVEAYLGLPMTDVDGKVLGIVVVLNDDSVSDSQVLVAQDVCRIFAARASAELERSRTRAELERHRDTLEKKVEERTRQLEASQDRLRRVERLASLGTLAAGLAHEINNPLGVIQLAIEAARRHRGSEQEIESSHALILENVKRCGDIVRNVLKFARAESSERRSGDVHEAVRAAVDITRESTIHGGVELLLALMPDPPDIVLNSTELEQVFVNLIQNAVKSCRPGGRVAIRSAVRGTHLDIEVSDDGEGISPEHLPRVFDPFFTTRLHQDGTGLGLSICHGIVADHGGTIDIRSKPEQGTTVIVRLPFAQPSSAGRQSERERR